MDSYVNITDIKDNRFIEYNVILEAIYSILLLCDYKILSPYHNNYQQEVKRYFTSRMNKDVIAYFSDLSKKRFCFVTPCAFALSLVLDNGVLKVDNPLAPYYVNKIGGEKVIDDCIYYLNSFLCDNNYLEFFINHRDVYSNYLMDYKDILYKTMHDVQQWYNCHDVLLTAYISQLVHPGGFGVSSSSSHAKCVVGSLLHKDDSIDVSLSCNVYFHEFSHFFVDQYVEDNWNSIKMLFKNRIYTILGSDDIYHQQEFICETIIRALSNYYCNQNCLNININDFLSYPLSKKLFQVLIEKNINVIDNNVYDILLTSMAEELCKEIIL